MIPAPWPRDDPRSARLLHVDLSAGGPAPFIDGTVADLVHRLRAPDLIVLNDAATLPASLRGMTSSGAAIEARLASELPDHSWRSVIFGEGDWRTRTEDRPAPPRLRVGEPLRFEGLSATVLDIDEAFPRLVSLRFESSGAALWRALYRAAKPVQYAHTGAPLSMWHVQTAYAARPWATEAPAAGFPLTWELLLELRRRGIGLAHITHAAGLSSTGDEDLDARLPLAERYDIGDTAVRAIEACHRQGGRVIAVGTTVTRALEGSAAGTGGRLLAGSGVTDIRLGPGSRRNVVDGILTGLHEPATSHFALLESFAPRALLEGALARAETLGYRGHEFGDAILIV